MVATVCNGTFGNASTATTIPLEKEAGKYENDP
jgi:hypothetical protein